MYECRYCKKSFVKETSLAVHMCESKRRFQEQDERGVQLGLHAYLKFYELTQGSAKLKTFEDFAGSPYYRAFVKFGRYIMHVSPLYPEKYIDYIIKSRIKLDHWARDDLYEAYLIDMLKAEPVEAALTRSIQTMMGWAEEQNVQWADYFRLVNTPRAVQHIQTGKVSPWLVLGCGAGKKMLNSFTDEQLQMVQRFINPEFWSNKFKSSPADAIFVQETAKEAKIE